MNYERNAELKTGKYIGHIIITITTTKLQYRFQKVIPQDERKIHFRCSISIDFFSTVVEINLESVEKLYLLDRIILMTHV